MMKPVTAGCMLMALWLAAACSREPPPPAPGAAPGVELLRRFDPGSVTRGAALFGEHCALCHGPQAQGHPDWQTPSDGQFAAAPPLNGTGNDWKRSRAELAAVIKNGVRRKSDNVEVMPAWKKRMNERDVDDLLNWLQSLWPPEVYDAWNKTQAAATPKT
jgi:mono/diheme cytochrome c family protein